MIKAAIFDVDGTLLDSLPAWQKLDERYLEKNGIKPEPGLSEKLSVMSMESGASYLKKQYRLAKTEEEIVEEILQMISDFYRFEAPLKPGVKETLNWLKHNKVRIAVATSGNELLAGAALERNGIGDFFERIFTCTEIGIGKEKPDIYLKTAEFLGSLPEDTLVFEDAFHAAQTAKAAGFVVTGVYDESSQENMQQMMEMCDYYVKRMDFCIEKIIL
ncbi:MAG: HAD family phosphatase [Blautia sp.]|nr:HAD family phosphatase [Blautia sp.]